MHGCRECDWDACESCMDQAESGLVKCETIRELVVECRAYLPQLNTPSGESEDQLALKALSRRLLEKETTAVVELASLLEIPGRITFHEFLGVIMPALYSACVSRADAPTLPQNHRSKKARMLGGAALSDSANSDSESRQVFCNAVVRYRIGEVKESKRKSKPKSEQSEERTTSDSTAVDNEFKGVSELVRRLQQVISLYEDVTVFPTSFENREAHHGNNELQSLKKPLSLTLKPSQFEEHAASGNVDLLFSVEPLLVIKDLEGQILRSSRLNTSAYQSYCSRYVEIFVASTVRSLF